MDPAAFKARSHQLGAVVSCLLYYYLCLLLNSSVFMFLLNLAPSLLSWLSEKLENGAYKVPFNVIDQSPTLKWLCRITA